MRFFNTPYNRSTTTVVVMFFAFAGLSAAFAEQHGAGLNERQWGIDGVTRSALVHLPAGAAKEKTPLVFVFHGRGGTSASNARKMAIHEHWPEAIVCLSAGNCPLPSGTRLPG